MNSTFPNTLLSLGSQASELLSAQNRGDFKVLNNSAMVLLRLEKNEEAIQLLVSALGATGCASFPQHIQGINSFLFHSRPVIHTLNADDASSESAEFGFEKEDLTAGSPSNFFSLYNRVFVFGDPTHDDWWKFFPHIPAVLLYNTGLVWHRMALKENSARKYNIALENYSMAHALVVQHARLGVYHCEICDILLLALCNNMGHIHSHFFRLEEARLCVEEMFAVFFLMEDKKVLTKDEYVFFYMGILLTVNRRPVLAPAA